MRSRSLCSTRGTAIAPVASDGPELQRRRTPPWPPGSFRIVQGETALKAWRPPEGHEKWFCGECGSAIFTRDPNDHAKTGVRLGAIDGDPGIRPEFRQFVAYAASWESIPEDGLRRYPERRPEQ